MDFLVVLLVVVSVVAGLAFVGSVLRDGIRGAPAILAPEAPAPVRSRWGLNELVIGAVLVTALLFGVKWVLQSHADDERQRQKQEQSQRFFDEELDRVRKESRLRALDSAIANPAQAIPLSTYLRLRDGMDYSEVSLILGKPGTPAASSSVPGIAAAEVYEWAWGASIVTCAFQDNRLVVMAQVGLR